MGMNEDSLFKHSEHGMHMTLISSLGTKLAMLFEYGHSLGIHIYQ